MKAYPDRPYTTEQLALFAQYEPKRAEYRPRSCDDGVVCWVKHGPPAIGNKGSGTDCRGCQAFIPGPHNRPVAR